MVIVYSKPNMPNFKYEFARGKRQAELLSNKFYPNIDYKLYTVKEAMLLKAPDGSRLVKKCIGYTEFRKQLAKLNE